jgi:hypothetical protein
VEPDGDDPDCECWEATFNGGLMNARTLRIPTAAETLTIVVSGGPPIDLSDLEAEPRGHIT